MERTHSTLITGMVSRAPGTYIGDVIAKLKLYVIEMGGEDPASGHVSAQLIFDEAVSTQLVRVREKRCYPV